MGTGKHHAPGRDAAPVSKDRGPFVPLVRSAESAGLGEPAVLGEPESPEDSGVLTLLQSLFSPAPPEAPPAPSAPPTTPIPSLASVTWTVLVASDRAYYDMRAERGLSGPAAAFPAHTSERRFHLAGQQINIGRRSATRELQPEIDLASHPGDPGISRLHAVLMAGPDGTWSILDPGSANGTFLNGRMIAVGQPVTLHEGDRINLGAWTVITVHRG